jgi:hypothetical protein
MSDRGAHLVEMADLQITELTALLASADDAVLRQPCLSRQKLGDGTVATVASHTADTYLRIAGFVHGQHDSAASHESGRTEQDVSPQQLMGRLKAGRHALTALANLTDEQLDAVPPPGQARFCDGQRTIHDVVTAMLKHQQHQVEALKLALERDGKR